MNPSLNFFFMKKFYVSIVGIKSPRDCPSSFPSSSSEAEPANATTGNFSGNPRRKEVPPFRTEPSTTWYIKCELSRVIYPRSTLALNYTLRCGCGCSARKSADISGTPTFERRPFPSDRFFIARHAGPPIGRNPNENFSDATVWPCPLRAFPFQMAAPMHHRNAMQQAFSFDPRVGRVFFSLSPFSATRGNHPGVTAAPPKENDVTWVCD